MKKEQLHEFRRKINNLFYYSFESLTGEQRGAFLTMLIEIDELIKQCEDF